MELMLEMKWKQIRPNQNTRSGFSGGWLVCLFGWLVWLVGLFRVVFVYGGCEVQKKMQLYVASILVGDFFIGPVLK